MKYYIILLLALFAAGCAGEYDGSYDYGQVEEMVDTHAVAGSGEAAYDEVDSSAGKKMVREGTMEMRSADVHAVKDYVDSQLKKYGGYYSAVNFGDIDGFYVPEVYRLEVKVPSAAFDDFLSAIGRSGGSIEKVSIKAVDVTDRYIDYEIRIASQKSYLERYRQLLSRSGTIKEVMEVQERIRLLETEIESTEARFRELAGRIQYSTLSITIRPTASSVDWAPGFLQKSQRALQWGWEFVKGFVIALLYLWPLLVLAALAGGIVLYYRRKKRREQVSGS
ncbi:MAG: DUF4349 domain-containing protein [Rikenellaceae bacterium]|nr:DUF4349 domain-containing protein [Rikenellaceae bacterium]